MGKASRTKSEPDRRARIAAQRAEQRRAEQRRRIYLAGGSILVVVIVVLAFVLVKLNSSGGTAAPSSNGPTGTALTKVVNDVTGVPTSVTDKVAGGTIPSAMFVAATTPSAVTSMAQTDGSYFATVDGPAADPERQARGAVHGQRVLPVLRRPAVGDGQRVQPVRHLHRPHDHALVEHRHRPEHAHADVLRLEVHEQVHLAGDGRDGAQLPDRELHQQQRRLRAAADPDRGRAEAQTAYDPGTYIPYIDFGNKYAQVGNLSPLTPTMLDGLTWQQVATDMSNPSSSVGQAIIANANYETAAICTLTNNQPATACTPTIQKLESTLAK